MDAAAAVQEARNAFGIATLILPSDASWGEGVIPATALPISPLPTATPPRIAEIAGILRSGEPTALVVTGNALEVDGLAAGHRIAALTQARLVAPTFNLLIQRGRGRHPIPLPPYVIDHAVAALSGIRHLVLVGAQEPAGFFAYPGKPSLIRPNDAIVHVLARADEDAAGALMALSSELGAPQVKPPASQAPEPASGSVNFIQRRTDAGSPNSRKCDRRRREPQLRDVLLSRDTFRGATRLVATYRWSDRQWFAACHRSCPCRARTPGYQFGR